MQFIERKLNVAKKLEKAIIVLFLLTVILFVIYSFFKVDELIISGFFAIVAIILLIIIRIEIFNPLIMSMKYLEKHQYLDKIGDLRMDVSNLQASLIFCGQHCFYVSKPMCIIPYSKILWAYVEKTKYMGLITVEQDLILMCCDDKKFRIKIENMDIPVLLNIVKQHSKELIVGYGTQQEKYYRSLL